MIQYFAGHARPGASAILDNMHRDRKRVFVDMRQWEVPVVDGQFEIDQFDGEDAVYLISAAEDGEHFGSIRLLPTDRPRYLMGVGRPADIVGAVKRGIDMFDCVMPTRAGRTAQAFTRRGELNMRNARHAEDPRPLDETVPSDASRRYSRAYLHHLFRCEEVLGPMLLTQHNIAFYQQIMRELRQAIAEGRLQDYIRAFAADQAQGDRGGEAHASESDDAA